jgi:tetratricopeptide (TPR) repeat protein
VVKTLGVLAVLVVAFAACVTLTPPPPSLYIEMPSPSAASELSLDDRIAVEDAWAALREGRTDKAQKTLQRLGPKNPFYYAGLGYVALVLSDLPAAEANFQRSVLDFPGLAIAHVGLGQVYRTTGQTDYAYSEFLEALKRDPDNAYAKREADFLRAEKTDQFLGEARTFAGQGNAALAKESFLKALEYAPKSQEAHLALARIYLQEKNFQSTLFHLKTASANDPNNTAILQDYADALFQSGQASRSLDAYQRLLELDAQNKIAKERAETIKGRLGVVELPSQYPAIASLDAAAKEDVAALIAVKFKDVLEDAGPKPPVIVDITTSWASRYIVKVASFALMEVFSNHTFQPRKPVTRAEMAETLVRLVNVLKQKKFKIVEQIPLDRIKIADIPQEHFYFPAIAQVLAYQLMDLAPDRTFKPEQNVTGPEANRTLDVLLGLIK